MAQFSLHEIFHRRKNPVQQFPPLCNCHIGSRGQRTLEPIDDDTRPISFALQKEYFVCYFVLFGKRTPPPPPPIDLAASPASFKTDTHRVLFLEPTALCAPQALQTTTTSLRQLLTDPTVTVSCASAFSLPVLSLRFVFCTESTVLDHCCCHRQLQEVHSCPFCPFCLRLVSHGTAAPLLEPSLVWGIGRYSYGLLECRCRQFTGGQRVNTCWAQPIGREGVGSAGRLSVDTTSSVFIFIEERHRDRLFGPNNGLPGPPFSFGPSEPSKRAATFLLRFSSQLASCGRGSLGDKGDKMRYLRNILLTAQQHTDCVTEV